MATTTPNYGWDVPTSTDYVADGAVAIETLGDDIDASLFSITSGKNVGLVHINTTSFTNVANVAVDSVFTSSFRNYRIVFDVSAKSTNGFMFLRFRAGGSDNTATQYNHCGLLGRTTQTIAYYGGSGDNYAMIGFSNASQAFNTIEVINPQIALNTKFSTVGHGGDLTTWFNVVGSGNHTSNTQFDGINFSPATGTFSGTVQIFGYRNS
jgi:hypothetical protein